MKFRTKQKLVLGVVFAALVLSACVFPEKNDPFSRLPEEAVETLKGEIFPFSVSVSTRATHRLEDEGKLMAYVASDIVRLDDFVGRDVEVDGVMRTEKMREIFWIEAIRLLDVEDQEEKIVDARFSTNRFAFIYSGEWEHSTSPAGVVHFIDKNDPARHVFLTFSVEEIEKEDKKSDPNILIASLAGIKKITTDSLDRERQEVVLFSNLYDHKYRFVFTSQFEEFEQKKSFFKLLNTFIEGEENVRKVLEEDKKLLAEKEAEKIEEKVESGSADATPDEEKESILDKLFGEKSGSTKVSGSVTTSPDKTPDEEDDILAIAESDPDSAEASDSAKATPDKTPDKEVAAPQSNVIVHDAPVTITRGGDDYINVIEEHAFPYESTYYQFKMMVPWGYWFRNFGQSETRIARLGFSDEEFTEESGSKFWLEIIGSETPPTEFSEKIEGDQVVIEFSRGQKSFFRISGPVLFRDAMRSIHATVESF
jgi:hypothetical protein